MNKELFIRILSSIILLPLVFFFIIKGSIFFNFFIIIMMLIAAYEWHFLSLRKSYYIPGFIFIIFSFYTFYFFRNESNYLLFLIILTTCIATDIGGYVFGKILKGPKLTKISPNKTYSGSLGSLILSSLVVLFFCFLFGIALNFKIFCIAIFTSIFCQLGDLIFSFLKRKAKVQDTGNILPGHGGLLDRIDGLLLGVPFGFIFFIILN